MSQPVRVGVVGLRFGRHVHVPAFRADARCEVVAVAGHDPVSAAAIAHDLGVPHAFTDWRELVTAAGIDAVAIAVPPAVQPGVIVEAARCGKHLFCEKPLAASLDQARQALARVQTAGVVHAINFIFPEVAAWRRAKALLADGVIGRPAHFAYSWRVETYASCTNAATWKNRPEEGGGALGNFVSHVFYNVEWLLGPIRAIEGFVCPQGPRAGRALDGVVELEHGAVGRVSVSTDAFLGRGHVLEIFGEQGTIVLRNAGTDYVTGFEISLGTRASGSLMPLPSDGEVSSRDGRLAATRRLVCRFVDAIGGGEPMMPNLAHGARVQELLARVAGSLEQVHRLPYPHAGLGA